MSPVIILTPKVIRYAGACSLSQDRGDGTHLAIVVKGFAPHPFETLCQGEVFLRAIFHEEATAVGMDEDPIFECDLSESPMLLCAFRHLGHYEQA